MKILINHGKVYKKIWDLAYKYQDKRDDRYHAKISTKFALILLKKNKSKKSNSPPCNNSPRHWLVKTKQKRSISHDKCK